MVPKCPSQGLTKFHIKASSSAKADDPVPRGASIDRWPGVYWIPRWSLSSGSPKGETRRRGVTVVAPLAFQPFWPQIGIGRLAVDEPLANRVRSGRKQP